MDTLFSQNLLSRFLPHFHLNDVPGIRMKTLYVELLIEELKRGKLQSLKEEEVKSRFIHFFFDQVLGFSSSRAQLWFLREEKKSTVDGTKPDAALGYFTHDKQQDDARVVIELKDALTDLDAAQKRNNPSSSVDQAFSYVAKMGGACKWVIVSNMKEIRFYSSLDRSRFQCYQLEDLLDERKLKELLFLFHKDQLIHKADKSPTEKLLDEASRPAAKDKPAHIVEKLYQSVRQFDGLGFVDPNYLAAIPPFNILDEHVWHYEYHTLFTLNTDIYKLLTEVTVVEGKLQLSTRLADRLLQEGVLEAEQKMMTVFAFLNHCMIYEIKAVNDHRIVQARSKNTIGFSIRHSFSFTEGVEGVTKNINVLQDGKCNCISCCYRTLNFDAFLKRLKSAKGYADSATPENAFGYFLSADDNFKTVYSYLRTIANDTKDREGKAVLYFLSQYNLQMLHNPVLDYGLDDGKQIVGSLKRIDLDQILFHELEFSFPVEVRDYLRQVKEDDLIYTTQDRIDKTLFEIEKLFRLYQEGNEQFAGPDLSFQLINHFYILYLHIHRNFIPYTVFSRYKSLVHKLIRGMAWSHETPKFGLRFFDNFLLTEAIIHLSPAILGEMLMPVKQLRLADKDVEELVKKLREFLASFFRPGLFGNPYANPIIEEQLLNLRFRDAATNIFANLFIVLSKVEISKEQFESCKAILSDFLVVEKELAWHDLKELESFLLQKGNLYEPNELETLLKIAIEGHKYGYGKYAGLIEKIPRVLAKNHPDYRLSNQKLVRTAILKGSSDNGHHENYVYLIHLYPVCDETCRQLLKTCFEEYLKATFTPEFYEKLLWYTDYEYTNKDFFRKYVLYIDEHKGGPAFKYGKGGFTDLVFINFALLVYLRKISFKRKELALFIQLNPFETWLINPEKFDYANFNPLWLVDLEHTVIPERLKGNKSISKAVKSHLQSDFHPVLAKLQHSFFH